jgi:hypothetical protein
MIDQILNILGGYILGFIWGFVVGYMVCRSIIGAKEVSTEGMEDES